MTPGLFVIAIAFLAAMVPSSVCMAQDPATGETREEWQSRVNATRERLKQQQEELKLEREKPLEPKREELRFKSEERLGPKQEELRLDREKRLGPKQEEIRVDREERIEPKRDELRRDRENQNETRREREGVVPPSPPPGR
jgi:hypothetical protein